MTQLDLSDFAEQPAARSGDPFTAQRAALLGGRSQHKALILRALYEHGPMHDEKIATVVGKAKASTVKRRGDLVRTGLVTLVTLHGQPVYATTVAGSPAQVWRLTTEGIGLAVQLPPLAPPPVTAVVPLTILTDIADTVDGVLERFDQAGIDIGFDLYDTLATAAVRLRNLCP